MSERARIAIVGLGAIGVSLADALRRSGLGAVGFSSTNQSLFRIDERGATREIEVPARATVSPESRGAFDIVFFCLKNDVLSSVFDSYLELLAPGGLVVCAQNGVMEYFMAEHLDARRILGAQVKAGCYLTPPDRLVITHPLRLVVGTMDPGFADDEAVKRMLGVLAGLPFARVVPGILPYKWSKLVFTSVTNPLCAITGLTADRLLRSARARGAVLGLLDETLSVARAEGIALAKEGPFHPDFFRNRGALMRPWQALALSLFSLGLKGMKVSMLHDIELGRKTEIDYLNGMIVCRGEARGLDLPYHRKTLALVHELESGGRRPCLANLDEYKHTVAGTGAGKKKGER